MAEPKIVVNGREYPFPENFTMGELADIEDICGQDYDITKGGGKGTLALAFIAIRRQDPRVTIAAIRNLTQDDFEVVGGDDGPPSQSASSDDSSGNAPTSTGSSETVSA